MILGTVGMHAQGFNRLVVAMDQIASQIIERVIIQIGSSTYIPHHAEYFQFTSGKHMEQLISNARVIVSHAAAGSVLSGFRMDKPMVLVPRFKKFGEHYDDHQLQLAQILAKQERVVALIEPGIMNLQEAIDQAIQLCRFPSADYQLRDTLREQLIDWSKVVESQD